jgi:hypothetical protein
LNHESKTKEEVFGKEVISSNSTKNKEVKRYVPACSLCIGEISSLWCRRREKDLQEGRND